MVGATGVVAVEVTGMLHTEDKTYSRHSVHWGYMSMKNSGGSSIEGADI